VSFSGSFTPNYLENTSLGLTDLIFTDASKAATSTPGAPPSPMAAIFPQQPRLPTGVSME